MNEIDMRTTAFIVRFAYPSVDRRSSTRHAGRIIFRDIQSTLRCQERRVGALRLSDGLDAVRELAPNLSHQRLRVP